MNRFINGELNRLQPISNEIEDHIRVRSKAIGSRVYGGATDASDLDLIMMKSDLPNIPRSQVLFNSPDYGEITEFSSSYIKTQDNLILNLLIFNDKSLYLLWSRTTNILKVLSETSVFKSALQIKKKRVLIFETIKTLLKEVSR